MDKFELFLFEEMQMKSNDKETNSVLTRQSEMLNRNFLVYYHHSVHGNRIDQENNDE